MKKSVIGTVLAIVAVVFIAACGSKTESGAKLPTGKTIKAIPLGSLTATLSNDSGQLKQGNQQFMVTLPTRPGSRSTWEPSRLISTWPRWAPWRQ